VNEDTNAQEEVFGFLADPASHGLNPDGLDPGKRVTRIDTHAASVFLAGDRALKVKRAVRFPFLDYSTLEKRKSACEAEVAVNAQYAPEIYRGVVAITRDGRGKLAIGGQGEAVEWAVEMRRFDESRTLDRLAGEIAPPLAEALGRAVAAAHSKAPIAPAAPWLAALKDYLDQNRVAFLEMPDLFASAKAAALDRHARAAYARLTPLLEARGRIGRVRRGHGDLHLGNIVLIGGRPVLFDAIEFDPLIASGDVLYDLAFLLMDLCERGRLRAANAVFNTYLAATSSLDDLDGLAALPFFLSLRAAIRAKVIAARIERAAASERGTLARDARAYFEFAQQVIAPPQPPQAIAVGGLSGTGKTQLAQALAALVAPLPGAVVLRSDVERKALFGFDEIEKLPPPAYAAPVGDAVYERLLDKARRIVAAGHSVVVDAVFARANERAAFAEAVKPAKVKLQGLFLTAPLSIRLVRLGGRAHDASDADDRVARMQENYDLGRLEWRTIDASGTPEQTLARARDALAL
jgi:uncharacterized protein